MNTKTPLKRLALVALAVLLALSCVGCNNGSQNAQTTEAPETEAPKSDYTGHFDPPTPSSSDLSAGDYLTVNSDLEFDDAYGKYVLKSDNFYTYIDCLAPFFDIGGIEHPDNNNGEYYRLDASRKGDFPADLADLAEHTSGATIRFRTNADTIKLTVNIRNAKPVVENWPHFSTMGAAGVTVYVGSGTDLTRVGYSTMCSDSKIAADIAFPEAGYKEVTVVLPIYAGVSRVFVGIPQGSAIATPLARTYGDIVFYGSSITQGAAVSHPGLSYSNVVCRMLNADCRNLGFSGGCRGEQEMCDYIATLDMAAFVLDYDWNAAIANDLKRTHYNVYKTVRDAHPDIPIIMMSRPIFTEEGNEDEKNRQAIVKATYDQAIEDGDTNVYFINGDDFYQFEMPDLCAMDFIHPNDLGHYYMAVACYKVLKPALEAKYPDAKI